MSRKKIFKLHPIKRSHRKIGRNEPCPCGRTKVIQEVKYEVYSDGSGEPTPTTDPITRRVKYKHCHGNEQTQAKMGLIKDKMNQYFYDLTHNKPKKAPLAVIVDKLKKAFDKKIFGRK